MREASRVRVASLLQLGPPLALPRAWLLEELKYLWYVILVKWRIEEEFEMNCVAGRQVLSPTGTAKVAACTGLYLSVVGE